MSTLGSLLVYIEVPDDCKNALPLMDLSRPAFSKLIRRVMKRLEKGSEYVEKPLLSVQCDGTAVESEFILVGSKIKQPSDVLFARLPGADGENEVYQLPFVRLTIRKNGDMSDTGDLHTDNATQFQRAIRHLALKLDHIDSAVVNLVEMANKSKRAPPTRKPASVSTSTSALAKQGIAPITASADSVGVVSTPKVLPKSNHSPTATSAMNNGQPGLIKSSGCSTDSTVRIGAVIDDVLANLDNNDTIKEKFTEFENLSNVLYSPSKAVQMPSHSQVGPTPKRLLNSPPVTCASVSVSTEIKRTPKKAKLSSHIPNSEMVPPGDQMDSDWYRSLLEILEPKVKHKPKHT